ncbi:hypothetical protein EV127DRAFT_449170, partial [Xylaria flabelliformis]
MAPLARNVFEVLVQAAFNAPEKGLTVLPQGWDSNALPERLSYSQLLKKACVTSQLVKTIPGICPNTIVLLHLDNHRDNVFWLWAVVAGGFVPAMSSPFTNDLTQRKKHLLHLHDVLQDPIVITREGLLSEFAVVEKTFRIFTIESLSLRQPNNSQGSGSTGHAKAVKLNHGQIISAIAGKAAFHQTMRNDTFLNWIEIGHVANLTEVHLHAMYHSAEQVHVHAVKGMVDASPGQTRDLNRVHPSNPTKEAGEWVWVALILIAERLTFETFSVNVELLGRWVLIRNPRGPGPCVIISRLISIATTRLLCDGIGVRLNGRVSKLGRAKL